MPYIACKPVRFDRDYSIGEIIPDECIDLRMEKRLIDWGKIIKAAIPLSEATSGQSDIKCPICDKICGSPSGLTSHMKSKHPEAEQ